MLERSRFALNRIICPDLALEEFFRLTAELGLNKIELRNDLPGQGVIAPHSPERVRALAGDYRLKILSINALQQFNLGAILSQLTQELRELVRLASAIGCQAIVLCPNNDPEDRRDAGQIYEESVQSLKAFAPLLEDHGLLGYLEPLGFPQSSLCSVVTAMEMIQASGSDAYRIVFDTFHHHLSPDTLELLEDGYQIPCTGLIHISGVEFEGEACEYRDDHRILVTPADRLHSKEQLKRLLSLGYGGDISFEPFAGELQKMDPSALQAAVKRSIEYLMS